MGARPTHKYHVVDSVWREQPNISSTPRPPRPQTFPPNLQDVTAMALKRIFDSILLAAVFLCVC